MRSASSEPNSFRIEPSGPGGSPRNRRVSPRNRVTCNALTSIASWASCWRIWLSFQAGSWRLGNCLASSVRRAIWAAWSRPPAPLRSNIRVVIATFQPSFSGADQVLLRHRDIFEKHLVEMPMAVQQHQRAHGDARRLHVDQQIADAVMLGRFGIGAHQQKAPIGEMRARGPHLLAVDDEMVALVDGAGPAGSRDRRRRRARKSPGTTAPRRRGCAADGAFSAPRCPIGSGSDRAG